MGWLSSKQDTFDPFQFVSLLICYLFSWIFFNKNIKKKRARETKEGENRGVIDLEFIISQSNLKSRLLNCRKQ